MLIISLKLRFKVSMENYKYNNCECSRDLQRDAQTSKRSAYIALISVFYYRLLFLISLVNKQLWYLMLLSYTQTIPWTQ